MRVAELSPALGAVVSDLDLSAPLLDDDVATLQEAFRTRHLILVREQEASPEQQIAFVSLFGTLRRPNKDGSQHAYISNSREGGLAGQFPLLFHSDGSFFERPVWGISLYAEEVHDTSPPTVFANAVRACDRLPAGLRARAEALDAVFVQDLSDETEGSRTREADIPADAARGRYARAEHPAVLRDYEGLDPVLYTNELQTSHFVGMDADESEALRAELLSYVYADDNTYRHDWQPHDLIVWNNVALQHGRPAHPADPKPRTLRRVVLTGRLMEELAHGVL